MLEFKLLPDCCRKVELEDLGLSSQGWLGKVLSIKTDFQGYSMPPTFGDLLTDSDCIFAREAGC